MEIVLYLIIAIVVFLAACKWLDVQYEKSKSAWDIPDLYTTPVKVESYNDKLMRERLNRLPPPSGKSATQARLDRLPAPSNPKQDSHTPFLYHGPDHSSTSSTYDHSSSYDSSSSSDSGSSSSCD